MDNRILSDDLNTAAPAVQSFVAQDKGSETNREEEWLAFLYKYRCITKLFMQAQVLLLFFMDMGEHVVVCNVRARAQYIGGNSCPGACAGGFTLV